MVSMNVSVYQAAAAMNAQAQWQEVIANNLAASSVPGFKKDDVTFAGVAAGWMQTEGMDGNQRFQMPTSKVGINFAPGEYRYTGNNLDLAIEGPGFFEVQMPDGQPGYTRDGEFGLNSSGQMVTKDGYLVMGDSGPIQTDPDLGTELTFSPSGEASQGTQSQGRLKVVNFDNPQLLQRMGGYFLPGTPGQEPQPVDHVTLRPSTIEESNISPMSEMTSLITSMRLFEANSRLLQMQDQHLEKAVQDLSPTT